MATYETEVYCDCLLSYFCLQFSIIFNSSIWWQNLIVHCFNKLTTNESTLSAFYEFRQQVSQAIKFF